MGSTEPERLPPPPFWRTRYFAFDILARRPYLDPIEIQRIIRRPERRQLQSDGRIRLCGYAASLGGHLRVVLASAARSPRTSSGAVLACCTRSPTSSASCSG